MRRTEEKVSLVLKTERTILRPFAETDAADLYAYAKEPRVGTAAGWKPHESVEESLHIIRTVFAAPHSFAVVDKAAGKVIGSAGFVSRNFGDGYGASDEIGYALSPDYWGRGIMPEVVAELLRYGFEERGLDAVWCAHHADNDRSRRVVEKSGFTYVFSEQLSDEFSADRLTYLYVCLRRDWEKKRRESHG